MVSFRTRFLSKSFECFKILVILCFISFRSKRLSLSLYVFLFTEPDITADVCVQRCKFLAIT